ncbi:hypothetical protein J6590_107976, partial [Homalodisca vitripennis]
RRASEPLSADDDNLGVESCEGGQLGVDPRYGFRRLVQSLFQCDLGILVDRLVFAPSALSLRRWGVDISDSRFLLNFHFIRIKLPPSTSPVMFL